MPTTTNEAVRPNFERRVAATLDDITRLAGLHQRRVDDARARKASAIVLSFPVTLILMFNDDEVQTLLDDYLYAHVEKLGCHVTSVRFERVSDGDKDSNLGDVVVMISSGPESDPHQLADLR